MLIARSRLLLIMFTMALASVLMGCVTHYPVPSERAYKMSPADAKRILTTEHVILNVISEQKEYYLPKITVGYHKLMFRASDGKELAINLKDIVSLEYSHRKAMTQYMISIDYQHLLLTTDFEAGQRAADAIFLLMQDAKNEGLGNLRFEETAKAYRSAAVKPVMSEEVRRYKAQAEGAIEDKRFEEAIDLYGEALKLAPWWPEGHFNRALVLSEIGEFNAAVTEMKRYLKLVPDAADARAAQDRIYDWERKGK